jgi:hypothetical protein
MVRLQVTTNTVIKLALIDKRLMVILPTINMEIRQEVIDKLLMDTLLTTNMGTKPVHTVQIPTVQQQVTTNTVTKRVRSKPIHLVAQRNMISMATK